MATKRSLLRLGFAVICFSLLLMGTAGYAQSSGTAQQCIDNFTYQLENYISDVEETNAGGDCYRYTGNVRVRRWGNDDILNDVAIQAFAVDKQCYVWNVNDDPLGDVFVLSGHDFSQWKQYLLGEGCDLVEADYVLPEARVVFLSSVAFTGNLIREAKGLGIKGRFSSGLEAADAICTKLASDAELPGASYTAWLSDSTAAAGDRIVHSTVPFVNVVGGTIANDWNDLISCGNPQCLINPINRTEYNVIIPSQYVWTETNSNGTAIPLSSGGEYESDRCREWTSTATLAFVGDNSAIDADWTNQNLLNWCESTARLYCFQKY